VLDVDTLTDAERLVLRASVSIYSKLVGWTSDDHPDGLPANGVIEALSTCVGLLAALDESTEG
jgi:hypothetical protein